MSAGEVAALVGDLVAIDSVNPDLVPGAAGEAEIARFVAAWLERAGLEVRLDEALPGRPNVIGIARGSGGGRSLMLNAHMDTVGVAGMDAPFEPRVEGNRLYGRGAYDMKGSLAAIMLAGARAAASGFRGDVVVTAVVDEEYASAGTFSIVKALRADAAIVTEPTELRVCVAHKGFQWLEIETRGVAAHGSLPDVGVDAIAKMGPVLTGIEELDARLRARPSHLYLGSGSVHASLIEGGRELSSYPDRCTLSVERRTVPGEGPEVVESQLRAVLDAAREGDPDFGASMRTTMVRDPFEVSEDTEVVQVLGACLAGITDTMPAIVGETAWMDSAITSAAGIPTVVFGPGGAGAHALEEWVDLDDAATCADVLSAAAREMCA